MKTNRKNKPGGGRPRKFNLEQAQTLVVQGQTEAQIAVTMGVSEHHVHAELRNAHNAELNLRGPVPVKPEKLITRVELQARMQALIRLVDKTDEQIEGMHKELATLSRARETYQAWCRKRDSRVKGRKPTRAYGIGEKVTLPLSCRLSNAVMSLEEFRDELNPEVVQVNRLGLEDSPAKIYAIKGDMRMESSFACGWKRAITHVDESGTTVEIEQKDEVLKLEVARVQS